MRDYNWYVNKKCLRSADVNKTLSMCVIMGIVRNEKKWKEMKMIFRLFSYFEGLEWPCVVGRWIRVKIGNNVIEKKYMVPF